MLVKFNTRLHVLFPPPFRAAEMAADAVEYMTVGPSAQQQQGRHATSQQQQQFIQLQFHQPQDGADPAFGHANNNNNSIVSNNNTSGSDKGSTSSSSNLGSTFRSSLGEWCLF